MDTILIPIFQLKRHREGIEKSGNLPQVTQLTSSRTRVEPRQYGSRVHVLDHSTLLFSIVSVKCLAELLIHSKHPTDVSYQHYDYIFNSFIELNYILTKEILSLTELKCSSDHVPPLWVPILPPESP